MIKKYSSAAPMNQQPNRTNRRLSKRRKVTNGNASNAQLETNIGRSFTSLARDKEKGSTNERSADFINKFGTLLQLNRDESAAVGFPNFANARSLVTTP